jgi:hypothetical protein
MQNRVNNDKKTPNPVCAGGNNGNFNKFYKTVIMDLPIGPIKIGNYQKKLNKNRVMAIVKGFNRSKMRPIEISCRGDDYWCWDGQTRLEAYRIMGLETIPCQVHYNLTYQDEARLFAGQRDNVGPVTSAHKWKALIEANDPAVMAITTTCAKHGFKVHPSISNGETISAIKALMDINKGHGTERLGDILWVLGSAWKQKDGSVDGDILRGMSLFFARYMLPEDTKKEYDLNHAIITRLRDVLQPIDPVALMAESTKYQSVKLRSLRVAYALVDLYNTNLSRDSKNRLLRLEL